MPGIDNLYGTVRIVRNKWAEILKDTGGADCFTPIETRFDEGAKLTKMCLKDYSAYRPDRGMAG